MTTATVPLITQDFIKFTMKDQFPGCRLRINDRMGGIVLAMTVWHYDISISLTQNPISLADNLGETMMTLTYLPKELESEKPAKKIILRRVTTDDPARLVKFIKGVRAYMRGIVLAINTATNDPAEKEADIFGFEGNDD